VLTLIIVAGFAQMVSVASIFPFLSLAGNPSAIQEWSLESYGLGFVKDWSETNILLAAGLASLLAITVSNPLTILAQVVRVRYAAGFNAFLRTQYLATMAEQPYSYFLSQNTGNLLARINEANIFGGRIFQPVLESISKLITIVFLIGLIVFVSPLGFLGALILAAAYAGIFTVFRKFRGKLSQNLRDAERGATLHAQQLLGGIKSIMVADRVDRYVDAFGKEVRKRARYEPFVRILAETPRYVVEVLVFGAMIGFMLFSIASGRFSLVTILPVISILAFATYRLLPAVQQVFAALSTMQATIYTLEGIEELDMAAGMRRRRRRRKSNPDRSQLTIHRELELDGLTFRYPGQQRLALDSISLKIPRHGSLGIMGQTGSGKSTLVDAILGLHKLESGEIRVDGRPLTEADFSKWRRSIGYVPQSIFLLDDTIAANIAIGLHPDEIDKDRLRTVAEAAQILNFIERELPRGFETRVGERGVRLSGGQMQRVGIARALYHDPQLLIFDEATSALDSATEAGVVESINSLMGEKTTIMIAHRRSTLNNCEYIIEIQNGKIVWESTAVNYQASEFSRTIRDPGFKCAKRAD